MPQTINNDGSQLEKVQIKSMVSQETIDGVEYVITRTPVVDRKAQLQKQIDSFLNNPMLKVWQEELKKLEETK